MYLQEINVKNFGPISSFFYKPQFNDAGNPVPIVLIGKNGTGKTLLLSNIVDSFIETKKSIYDNIKEVEANKYYKIGTKEYIKNGTKSYFCKTMFSNKDHQSTYIDISSNDPTTEIEQKVYEQNEINDLNRFKQYGFSRKLQNNFTEDDFQNSIMIYFPSDRFYIPRWYNNSNYKRINYDVINTIGSSNTNIIKTDLLNNVDNWLIDAFMSTTFQSYRLGNDEKFPEELRNKVINVPQNNNIQNLIQQIFNIIKGTSTQITRPSRKNKKIGIAGNCYDLSQMSSGEIWIYSLALSIIKEWDILHQNDFQFSDIMGTVIIDEIDQSLHIDYIYKILPQIINLFPKIQFIVTGHSPFLIAGLKNDLNVKPEILSMPNGAIIDNIDEYDEVINTYNIFLAESDKLIERKNEIEKELNDIKSKIDKLIIIPEGKTDALLLQTSLNVLDIDENLKNKIVFWNFVNYTTLGDELNNISKYLINLPNVNKIVCIHDRDKKQIKNNDGKNFAYLGNKVYEFNLPPIENKERKIDDKICIEHYFSNDEIKTETQNGRLYMKNDFDKYGTSNDGSWSFKGFTKNNSLTDISIIDANSNHLEQKKDGAKIITKEDFAEYVQQHTSEFNFQNFKKIFEILIEIDNDIEIEN